MFSFLKKIFGSAQDRTLKRYRKLVAQVNEWDEKFKSLSDEQLQAKTEEFRQRFRSGATTDDLLPEAYAVVKNACRRLTGTEVHVSGYDQRWDMIPYDVQIIGAIAMHNGSIAEMQTGEGKTLTAVMPLYLHALTNQAVHLVTVNDYLATRDCQWVGAVLRWLGLTTGTLTNDVPPHIRKEIYACDVVYGTASEFGFDYLRDNSMAMRADQQVQRGYYYAIVDEIDSILIDEARTPLIISGPVPDSRQMYAELKEGVSILVRQQRDLCNRHATEAKKILEKHGITQESSGKNLSKSAEEECREAFRKLWLVGKGTPHNKILRRLLENPDIRASVDQWDLHFYSDPSKQEKNSVLSELYIIIDEKASEYELTDRGISQWSNSVEGASSDDFVMIDLAGCYLEIDEDGTLSQEEKMKQKLEVQEEDIKRKERSHNLRQLLRAHLLMEKDVDYIIQDNQVVIIDEHTGRPQPGRRFSDGLHQAIEAKEMVKIQKETQTYATITLQNYFRMYKRLAGMTGTASTEAQEFQEIYKLDALEIPTHKKCVREDFNDEIYMTEREKYQAILKEIKEIHEKGRPILIGTESVEISEKLSRILRQNGLEHTVLNAKHNAQEADIVARAGQRSAITVSTNMAGRGTDIKLGEGVAALGGLYVIGSTRHNSRRIDRQLRGRCARQGDPGTSKFYISFEDQLMRLFASPRLTAILQKLRPPEGEPISARILNKSIETAQKRVEQRNFTIRKHTLEYDDVMNKQRQEIYSFRNELLHTGDTISLAITLLDDLCAVEAEKFFRNKSEEDGWDPAGFQNWLTETFPISCSESEFDSDYLEFADIYQKASEKLLKAFSDKVEAENIKAQSLVPEGIPYVNHSGEAVRFLMVRVLDKLWQEHLLHMDHLRSEVNLRTVAQRDPLLEFKHEAFSLFNELTHKMKTEIARDLFKFRLVRYESEAVDRLLEQMKLETGRSLVDELENESSVPHPPPARPGAASAAFAALGKARNDDEEEEAEEEEDRLPFENNDPKVGRNDPCPCGSGKKYKKCCAPQPEHQEPRGLNL